LTIQLSRAQFAIVLGLTLVMFSTGVVAGAAGSTMIIGSEANNAGAANTQLLTNSSVVAFKLLQNGPGTALMGYATPITGTTRGVYGRVDSPNGDGVQGRNAGPAGTGAAVRGYGGENAGAVLSSDADYPLELVGPVNVAPMTVNSSIKVANLNADQLDGKTSADFVLNETVVGHSTCAGNTLVPDLPTGWARSAVFGSYSTTATDVTFRCDVAFPDGATVTEVAFEVSDANASANVGCFLLGYEATNGGISQFTMGLASTTDGDVAGTRTMSDATINFATIDNAVYHYLAECVVTGTTESTQVHGIRVSYEVTGLPVP
jgi:hypothetical protein